VAEVRLTDFIGQMAKRRIDFASGNCFTFCADWIKLRTGYDPALPWRRIVTRAQARSAVRAAGGEEALVAAAMAKFQPTEFPQRGDVALVVAPVVTPRHPKFHTCNFAGNRAVGAICVAPGRFGFLTDRGLAIAPLPVLRAWRIVDG
jgi:hypothetical protein